MRYARTTSLETAAPFIASRQRRRRLARARRIVAEAGHAFVPRETLLADGATVHSWSCACHRSSKRSWPSARDARMAWEKHAAYAVERAFPIGGAP